MTNKQEKTMLDNKQLANRVLQDPNYLIAFGFGSGLFPLAPGTCGTLAAIPFYLLFSYFHWIGYIVTVFIAFLAGVTICERVSLALGVHDYPGIVWDEFVGFWITMFLAPAGWIWIGLGFVLFRFFDILKPWPINYFDNHVLGGLGIMIDDVIAGIFAWGSLQLVVLGTRLWH